MLGPYFSLNGHLLPIEKAVIPLDNLEFSYGFGVYETLKVRKRLLYFPEKHIERLFHSAAVIGLHVPLAKERVLTALYEFTKNLSEESTNIKILGIGNNLYIFATAPLYVPEKLYRDGVKVITTIGERLFPRAKTLNMLMSYLAYAKAKEEQAYDALLVDQNGFVREGTRTNLFFTDGKTLFTPPAEQVLEGVTKLTLAEALQQNGIVIQEKKVRREELSSIKGLFLTSTSSKVLPISVIDGIAIEIPLLVRKIMEIYDRYLTEYAKTNQPKSLK